MIWSPTGPSVAAGLSPANEQFVPAQSANLGGVARIVNLDAAPQSFSIGGSTVDNVTPQVRLAIGQEIYITYGPGVTHISASNANVHINPGIARP
jgi:hypothetical protein